MSDVEMKPADTAPETTVAALTPAVTADTPAASTSNDHKRKRVNEPPVDDTPLDEVLRRRLATIKEGDNVLLRLASDSVKAVVASRHGLVQLGKFGAFPASELIGLPYDITYQIVPQSSVAGTASAAALPEAAADGEEGADGPGPSTKFGQNVSRKKKNKMAKRGGGRGGDGEGSSSAGQAGAQGSKPGWQNVLRPLPQRPIVEAVLEDVTETNEFIDDHNPAERGVMSHEEIAELKAQGLSAEAIIQRQMARHENFDLKTDFSKEKWRKRKEKKYLQTVHPIAPSALNMVTHYGLRSPQSILYLREDTLSQMLVLANLRPGGRYLVVDDTGGLVTSAAMERIGCEGRILTFTENDSPPAWGILSVMNWGEREMQCVQWLNWMEADEAYERPPPPVEDDMPAVSSSKSAARLKKHAHQVAELNKTRGELYAATWDGLILATELSPLSVLARLTPYLAGSATITVYSPYHQILAELLQWTRKDGRYLNANLLESWTRTYQVLPGRTHPLMTTSATGGYLFHATRVHPGMFQPGSSQRAGKRQNKAKKQAESTTTNGDAAKPNVDAAQANANDEQGSAADLDTLFEQRQDETAV